jgi:acetyltransferase-like isoleucine patch superfamily enzyme
MLRKKFGKLLILSKFYYHLLVGKVFGISHIVRYLRNPDPLITVRLLRAFEAKIGEATTIKRTMYLDNVYEDENSTGDFFHLKIGNNCYIGDCTYFDLANEVIIGNDVVISGDVSFVTHADCNRSKYLEELFPRTCEKIIVHDGAWVAFKTTILNGVTIGENSVVTANSLVKKDVENYSVYAGIPAKKIRSLR